MAPASIEFGADLGEFGEKAGSMLVRSGGGEDDEETVAGGDGEAGIVEPAVRPLLHGPGPRDVHLSSEGDGVDVAIENAELLGSGQRSDLQLGGVEVSRRPLTSRRLTGGDDSSVCLRVLGEGGDGLVDDQVGHGDRVVVACGRIGDCVDEVVDHSGGECSEQAISGANEVVDGGGGDTGSFGDLFRGDLVEGVLVEEFDGGVEDRRHPERLVLLSETGHERSVAAREFLDNSPNLESTTNMRHDEQVRLTKELLARLDSGTNVDAGGLRKNPVEVYTDPDLAEREWQAFFASRPQVIGLSGDLPEPGSFLTTDDLGLPVVATRSADGVFHAFINSCRHRGAVLIEEPRGTARRMTCPFHSWTYDSAGTLVGLPKQDHFGEVDTECLSLIELPSAEWNGLLLVHPDPDGEVDPAALFPEDLAAEIAEWNFGELEYLDADSYDIDCNWKLAMDTFGETYHFSSLHKDTLFGTFHGNAQCYDTFGLHHRMILTRRSIDQMRHLPEDEWNITVAGLPVYWLFPNVQLMPNDRGAYLVRAIPDPQNPGRHTSRITFYVQAGLTAADYFDDAEERQRQAEQAGEELALQRLVAQAFAQVIRDEDYWMAASQQRTAESGRTKHSLFGRNEPALHHYHSTYRAVLGMEPLPLLSEAEV